MSGQRELTPRGVRAMLARSGVDHSALSITHQGTTIKIEGPKYPRNKAFHALFDRGLACAPFPEYDLWSRR